MPLKSLSSRPARRTYSPQFKAQMVAQCLEGNVPLASLAVDQGMNPNVLHRWVMEHERYGKHTLQDDSVALPGPTTEITPANWLAVQPLPALAVQDNQSVQTPALPVQPTRSPSPLTVAVTLTGGSFSLTVRWPVSEHQALAQWTRDVLT